MIPELGQALVLLALAFASIGTVLGFWAGWHHHMGAWTWARRAAFGFSGSMIAANLLMVRALLVHDFSVHYVAEVGSRATPLYFTIVSLWASLNGSILFWGGILGVYVALFLIGNGTRHREYMPYTIGMMLANAVFFSLLVASIANPFERVSPIPADGPGPNPLLQNHWLMAVHPPTLYLGYVGMVVPYAMVCAALFAGRLDNGWMVPLRRWMAIPWMFLTVGIVLGGWWSYGVLGWGGAWAWDPVENASFHPWLTATAFLHSAMVFQHRGALRIWTLLLGMVTFLLTLLGTFMTRSGVFNSVHSFTQSDIGPVFLVFIGVVLTFSIVLLAVREHTLALEDDERAARTSLMAAIVGRKMHVLSREFALLLQNVVFSAFTFAVLLGTLFPLITEAVQKRQVSVGEPYFDRWALPLGLILVFLMGVGPALPWGRMPADRAARRMVVPVVGALATVGAFAAGGFTSPMVLLALGLCGFASVANVMEVVTPVLQRVQSKGESITSAVPATLRRMRRRFGGHIAHQGVVLAVVALALSKGYKHEVDVTLDPGESAQVGAWSATFVSAEVRQEPHRTSDVARFEIRKHGELVGVVEPKLNRYPTQREPVFTPAIHETAAGDFYVSLTELNLQKPYVVVRLIDMPGMFWLWVAPVVIALGTIIAVWPERRRSERGAPVPGAQTA